jgi:hypothetical protein
MNTMCGSSNMCNAKVGTNTSNVNVAILIWKLVKLMSICTTIEGLCLKSRTQ